ncbi:NUDIX hydrolase [Cellulosimicrobium marinum]|uniref:NUDIX hydrolase n=1 Tax=Cellulosimicrobium marinum TaxID=1638992 RepID=UPI001E467256|nr:NUDIX domain-containing protein [Cellulosimicrobium marinum]MCB7135300.1 NUDIX domain-containing protein [Cellulosimicrobium marinum]
MTFPLLAADALGLLVRWQPVDPAQAALAADYADFLRADDGGARADAVRRDGGPEHLTGSCFVLSPDLAHVLLCYHRKGRFWVQVGGHPEEGDTTLAGAALREAREESGLADLVPFAPDGGAVLPVDVHRHDLAAAFGACRAHRDVGFVAFADPAARTVVSDESEDVAWFAVDDLPAGTPPDFPDRLATVLAEVRGRRETPGS